MLRAHAQGLPDGVHLGADVPAADLGGAGGRREQAGQDRAARKEIRKE